uniref:Uncharacterized protein n=1 Tax=Setaria italica TaxID=4555 RepID=K3ZKM0_SETIT
MGYYLCSIGDRFASWAAEHPETCMTGLTVKSAHTGDGFPRTARRRRRPCTAASPNVLKSWNCAHSVPVWAPGPLMLPPEPMLFPSW